MLDVRQCGHLLMHSVHAAKACRSDSAAVVRVLSANKDFLVGLPQEVEIPMHQANIGVIGF